MSRQSMRKKKLCIRNITKCVRSVNISTATDYFCGWSALLHLRWIGRYMYRVLDTYILPSRFHTTWTIIIEGASSSSSSSRSISRTLAVSNRIEKLHHHVDYRYMNCNIFLDPSYMYLCTYVWEKACNETMTLSAQNIRVFGKCCRRSYSSSSLGLITSRGTGGGGSGW